MSLHDRFYQSWLLQLQTWAADGRFFSAGVDALQLKPGQATDQLKQIANRLAEGETRDLPPIEVLPGGAMPGAAGAYASSNNTIYLNANWLKSASKNQVVSVLNEELGHHLDALLNNSDAAGDEGELFAILLSKETLESLNLDQLKAIRTEQDQGFIETPGGRKSVEFAVITGTNTAETLTGTADADTITGGNEGKHATGDKIYGLGGADTLAGGSGFDWIYGGGGADEIYAGSVGGLGDATRNGLFGGEGDDLIYGGKKQDVLRGDGNQQGLEVPSNSGNDELSGGNGHDLITGGDGNDFLSGGQGDDYLDGGPGSDIIKAGPTGDAKSGRTDYYYQHDGHSTIWTGAASLTGSLTLINGETITFANGTDVIYGFHHSDDQLYLPGTTFNVINGGDNLNNLTIGSNYFIQGTWSVSTSAAALSAYQASNFSGSFTTGEDAADKDFLVLYNAKSESFFNTNNTNFLVLSFDDAGLDSSSSSEPADMVADPSESLRELPIRITGPSGDSGDNTVSYSLQDGDVDVHIFTNGSTAASKTTYWAIVGGDDESLFSINETIGALSFVTAPDFDNPTDSNTDNTYDVIVRASYSNETTSFSRSTDYRSVDVMQTLAITIDNTPPTVAVTSDVSSLSAGETVTLTFTLSEAATDFVEADVAISGGSLSNWTTVSSTVYTATFTPTADSTTDGLISIASSKFSDSAGNNNNDGSDANNSVTLSIDTTNKSSGAPCFASGCCILLANGVEQLVQNLRQGDKVITHSGIREILWIGRKHFRQSQLKLNRRNSPIAFLENSLGDNIPAKTLYVSEGHYFHINSKLIAAGCLVNGINIIRVDPDLLENGVCYWHIDLGEEQLVKSNSCWSGSYYCWFNRRGFCNWSDYEGDPDQCTKKLDLPRFTSIYDIKEDYEYLVRRALGLSNKSVFNR